MGMFENIGTAEAVNVKLAEQIEKRLMDRYGIDVTNEYEEDRVGGRYRGEY